MQSLRKVGKVDTYISFDLETTGLSPQANEIIEIGAWKIQDGVVTEKFSTLVKPRGYYGRDIQRLTGITPEMLEDACEIEDIMPSFIKFCGDLPLLGYGLKFDYDFICTKAKPMGYDFTLNNLRTGIDVLQLCKTYYKGVSHKLEDMAKHLNVAVGSGNLGFHRAEYDAYITKLIYDRFIYGAHTLPNVGVPVYLSKESNVYGKAENYGTLSFK